MLDARSNTPLFRIIRPKKVRSLELTLRPFFIISLAFIFLLNSIGGGLFVGESWAAKNLAGLTSVGPERTGGPTPLKEINPDTFTLPQELGYIQESVKVSDSKKTVIHIQDAHCNYAAQKSISEILNYLTKEYGVNMVNCEGGAGSYDLSPFINIPEKDIREKTSDFFVKEGVVSAAEFFAVNNPKEVKLWGVEDPDLYIKDLKIYRDSLSHKEEADRYIKSISYILDNLKRHIYSGEILEFDDYYTRYKAGKITFKEYMKHLIVIAQKKLIDIKSFSDIYLLSQTLEQEERIDFKKANNEKDEVVDRLRKVLSRNELEELTKKVGQLKSERISQADFYAYLIKKAKSVHIDLASYPELQKYVIYVSLYSAVDRTKITKEIDTLEDRIKELMYENDTQRELGILSKNLVLTGNMFNISLTREDYAYYTEHSTAFSVSNYEKFIEKEAPLYKIKATLDDGVARLDIYRESMEKFYQCSLERDKAFVKNIKFTDHDRPNSIIITGGFHTQNLRELFKDENVSYISIMPKFTNPPGYESPYLKRLAGQRTALENVIDTAIPAVLNLQVVEIMSKLGPMVEGELMVELFKHVLVPMAAAFMRGQSFILEVGKGIPVRGAKTDDKKFVTFPSGGSAMPAVSMSEAPENVNAIITKTDSGKFEFRLIANQLRPAVQAQQPPPAVGATEEGVPVYKPVAKVVERKAELLPQEGAKAVVSQAATATKVLIEPTYEAAVEPAVGVKDRVKNTATRIVTIVSSKEGTALVASLGQYARKMNPNTHITSYEANINDRTEELKGLREKLETELKYFVTEDWKKTAPLMEIRIKERMSNDVTQMIKAILADLKPEAKIEDIMARIKLVQVALETGERATNPAIEFFADIGMLECYRYTNGDFKREDMPPDLDKHFLALLKLSIKNGADFEGKTIDQILDMIFSGYLLKIRPVDLRSIDEWNHANRQLMQSV